MLLDFLFDQLRLVPRSGKIYSLIGFGFSLGEELLFVGVSGNVTFPPQVSTNEKVKKGGAAMGDGL